MRVRIGIGHPGQKDLVTHHVLHDFAKADHAWLEPLLDAIAAEAPYLAEGASDKFQSRVAHALQAEPAAEERRAARQGRARAQGAARRDEDRAARQPGREAPPLVRRVKAD